MAKIFRGIVAAGVLAALALGLSPASAATQNLDLSLCAPTGDKFDDGLTIDNPYFPLSPGQQSVFFGLDEGEPLGLRIEVLNETENFYEAPGEPNTVVTRVVEELEWADENADGLENDGEDRIEISRNYFAQAGDGTVCYFGEDVKIYEDGKFKGDRSGSWRADAAGNAPGIFMPATPKKGQHFDTEAAPGVAQDDATIVGVRTVSVPFGRFRKAIEVEDCNQLEPGPDNCGTKYYAPGVGLIVDGDVELTDFEAGTAPASKAKKP